MFYFLACGVNQTILSYQACIITCDSRQTGRCDNSFDPKYCYCKDGYIFKDANKTNCILAEECPDRKIIIYCQC